MPGLTIPTSWFQSINPLGIFLLTPLYVSACNRRAARGREASSVTKMRTGAAVVALAYAVLALVARGDVGSASHSPWVLVGVIAMITVGELFILPVGLGLFGRLAPEGLSASVIALWFLAAFFGNLLAGFLGRFWSVVPHALYFSFVASLTLASAVLLAVISKPMRALEQVG
jgi:POT family proton-dependent oligopeptide transporter